MDYESMAYYKKKQKQEPRPYKITMWTNKAMFERINAFREGLHESMSESMNQLCKRFFTIERELKKWQMIAQSQMDLQKQLENKLQEKDKDE